MGKMEDLVEQMKTHMDAKFKILETQIMNLKTKLDQIENDTKAKLLEFENKFDKIEENTSELRNNTSKSWAEVAGGSQKVFKEIAIATRSEFEQTDAREKNLIIYNKTENEDPEHDHKTDALEIIELTKVEHETSDITKAFRIGKKEEGKTRPIRVTVKSKELRDRIVKASGKLSGKDTIITPDRSADEREKVKNMVKECKTRNESPEHPNAPKNLHKWVLVGKLHPFIKEVEIKRKTGGIV